MSISGTLYPTCTSIPTSLSCLLIFFLKKKRLNAHFSDRISNMRLNVDIPVLPSTFSGKKKWLNTHFSDWKLVCLACHTISCAAFSSWLYVLQCFALCCRVLQCVAVCCINCAAFSSWLYMCCSMLQCVAVSCITCAAFSVDFINVSWRSGLRLLNWIRKVVDILTW